MAQQQLNVGSAPDASDGDDLRAAMQAVNANFSDLYNLTGALPTNQGNGTMDGVDADIFGLPGASIRSVTTTSTSYLANRILYKPWILPYPITLRKVRVRGSNSAGATTLRLGIVKANANTGTPINPGLMWQDNVSIPLTTPADRDISSIDVDLEPGFYWLLSKSDTASTTMVETMALPEFCKFTGGVNSIFFGLFNTSGPAGAFADPVPTPDTLTAGSDVTKGMGIPFLMQWDSRAQIWS